MTTDEVSSTNASNPIDMSWEELIAKAEEHAKAAGIPVDQLHEPKVRETAVVLFRSKNSRATAKFQLDAVTGDLITAEFSDPDFSPTTSGLQFTKRAQRVLALTSKESRRVGSDHVGADHLLLGLLVYGEGTVGAVLSKAGLTAEAVRSRITTVGSAAEVAVNGYGPSMRNALQASLKHAAALKHSEIEPEHLALGLLDKDDGPAMGLFRHFGIDIERVRKELLQKISGGGTEKRSTGRIIDPSSDVTRFRIILALFIIALLLSGITAFPLRWELNTLASWMGVSGTTDVDSLSGLKYWIAYVNSGLEHSYRVYPFLAYGTDWLAFAHIAIAVFFIGPLREPTKHDWILVSGIIACAGVLPLALICGPLRGIPFYWRCIDCSFGLLGVIPLIYCLRISRRLKNQENGAA